MQNLAFKTSPPTDADPNKPTLSHGVSSDYVEFKKVLPLADQLQCGCGIADVFVSKFSDHKSFELEKKLGGQVFRERLAFPPVSF